MVRTPKFAPIIAFVMIIQLLIAPSSQATKQIFSIAYQGPLSGGEASTGIDEQNAVKYAVKIFMAKNPGIEIKIVSVDDQGDPAVASIVAPGIGLNESILGVVGPAYSGSTIASLPYYKAGGLVMISPSATRPSLTDPASVNYGQPIFHRVVGKDDFLGQVLAKYATAGISSAKVFVFDDQSAYAVPLRGFVEAGLKKIAGAAVVGGDSVPNTTREFAPTIEKIKTSRATVVIYTGYYPQAAIFIKQLRISGSTAIFAGGDGVFNEEYLTLAGAWAEGSRITGVGGLEGISLELEKDFKKQMGFSSGAYSVESFDAANILLEGIKAGNTTRAKMLMWVKAYKGKGVSGTTIKFDTNGDISYGLFAGFTVKSGVLINTGIIKATNSVDESSTNTFTPAAPAAPAAPQNVKIRVVGTSAVISAEANLKSGGLATQAHVFGASLGVTKANAILGKIVGNKVLLEVPLKASMSGKRFQVTVYLSNEIGESPPVQTSLTVPAASKIPSGTIKLPTQTKEPKTVSCLKGTILRTFVADSCPPGWKSND